MKLYLTFIFTFIFAFIGLSQNLYNNSNAVNITNDSNSPNGWSGGAMIISDNTDSQNGQFCIRVVSTANNSRDCQYTFNAEVGRVYDISIWAKTGA